MDNSSSDFITVFNILESGYRQWWLCLMSIVIAGVFAIVVGPASRFLLSSVPFSSEKRAKQLLLFRWVFLVAAVLWSLVAFATTYPDYRSCYNALASGKTSYIEGTVDDFVPMPYQGHAAESFTVNGVHFSYTDYGTPGFTNTSSHGGPMRSGLYVRIWYLGNDILKLQIKKNSMGAATTAGGG